MKGKPDIRNLQQRLVWHVEVAELNNFFNVGVDWPELNETE